MIQAIRPTAREAYDRGQKWDKEEDARFAQRLSAMSRRPAMPEIPMASNANFDNPAFNILTGSTNYALHELADIRSHSRQLELFREPKPIER
jgi:hypothetical protein